MPKRNLKTLIRDNVVIGVLTCVAMCLIMIGFMKVGIDHSIKDANKLVVELKDENTKLKKSLNTATSDLSKSEATNKATKDENAELKKRLDKAEIDNKRIEKKIDTIIDALKN